MDPDIDPVIFVEIKSVLRNFRDFPNLVLIDNDREILARRRTVLSKKVRYECSGENEDGVPCPVQLGFKFSISYSLEKAKVNIFEVIMRVRVNYKENSF
jgi:hypothetical protein